VALVGVGVADDGVLPGTSGSGRRGGRRFAEERTLGPESGVALTTPGAPGLPEITMRALLTASTADQRHERRQRDDDAAQRTRLRSRPDHFRARCIFARHGLDTIAYVATWSTSSARWSWRPSIVGRRTTRTKSVDIESWTNLWIVGPHEHRINGSMRTNPTERRDCRYAFCISLSFLTCSSAWEVTLHQAQRRVR
jgi:hypothetical protein